MNISFAGSGNVATVLALLCISKGHVVRQVLSRNTSHAETLAKKTGASYGNLSQQIDSETDLIIAALSDEALLTDLPGLKTSGKLIVHTAGAVPCAVLKDLSSSYGVLYPLQSLRKELNVIPEIPFLIDGSDESSLSAISSFAYSLSSMVFHVKDSDRKKLHMAAVVVNNFTNHLFALAEDFCKKEGIDFKMLIPLIKETACRLHQVSPSLLQTGPAERNDLSTIQSHLQILSGYPELRELYQLLTDSIRQKGKSIIDEEK